MRLADSDKEVHGALVCQKIQEPHKLPMQAAGGRRDQGQESLSVLQVVEAVVRHLALGSVDEYAIGVLSMPKRSVATDVVTGAVELMDHGDVDDQVSLVSDVCIPNLEVASRLPRRRLGVSQFVPEKKSSLFLLCTVINRIGAYRIGAYRWREAATSGRKI